LNNSHITNILSNRFDLIRSYLRGTYFSTNNRFGKSGK